EGPCRPGTRYTARSGSPAGTGGGSMGPGCSAPASAVAGSNPASISSTRLPPSARRAASGPPPAPEPTTMKSNGVVSGLVAAASSSAAPCPACCAPRTTALQRPEEGLQLCLLLRRQVLAEPVAAVEHEVRTLADGEQCLAGLAFEHLAPPPGITLAPGEQHAARQAPDRAHQVQRRGLGIHVHDQVHRHATRQRAHVHRAQPAMREAVHCKAGG